MVAVEVVGEEAEVEEVVEVLVPDMGLDRD